MIKSAINRVLELAAPIINDINGRKYSDKDLVPIDEELRASAISMNTLTGLIDYIKGQKDFKEIPYIVQIVSPTEVRLFSCLDADRKRETLVDVTAEIPDFSYGRFIENEAFIIGVQSKFLDDNAEKNDKPIVLQFAGNVKAGTVAEYGDTGVGQKATIKKGAVSMVEAEVPSPCFLMPYRTFIEVEQPMSSFIFRVKDNERLGVEFALFEADGGAWKNKAKANIKAYLVEALKEYKNITVIS